MHAQVWPDEIPDAAWEYGFDRSFLQDLDDEVEKEPWLENPIMGAEELLRFSRARQILLE